MPIQLLRAGSSKKSSASLFSSPSRSNRITKDHAFEVVRKTSKQVKGCRKY